MKLLKITLLGAIIWAVSLFWPQVNQWLSANIMLTGVIGSAGLIFGYILSGYFQRDAPLTVRPYQPIHRARDITDTHPMKPLGMA